MANPTCSNNTLVINAAKYRLPVIDPIRQKALTVLAKVYHLKGIGGTDYTSELTGTLLTDTVAPPSLPEDVAAARVAVAFANATSAGGSPPSTLATQLAAAKALIHVPGGLERLNQIELYLDCALGRSKNYPQ